MNRNILEYEDARELIETGDIVSVRTAHGLFGLATKLFTRTPYTHNGIAIWLDQGLWLAEINGGKNHAIPLSQLADQSFDVYLPPKEVDLIKLRTEILESLRVRQSYGYAATVAIGLLEWLGLDIFVHWRNMIVCSGYIIRILERAGWAEHSYITSPGKLSKLLELKLSVGV